MHEIQDVEERIKFHRSRITRRLRRSPDKPRCWACHKTLKVGVKPESQGWYARPFEDGVSAHLKELYCPDCFRRWGWGDELPRA